MFLLLMKFHVLDKFLTSAIFYVSKAFTAVLFPFL